MNSRKKKTVKAEVISNKKICADHFLMDVRSGFLRDKSHPGQFVNVKIINGVSDPLLRVPLGVHRIEKKGIALLYKVVGRGTEQLSRKRKGDTVDILGPLGKGFDTDKKNNLDIILVSGGHGIAPLYGLGETLIKKKNKIDLFVGSGSKRHLVCLGGFKKLGIKVHIATDDGSRGHKGYVTELLEKDLKLRATNNELRTELYACGPKPMLKKVSKLSEKYKIPAQISVDEYMACGIGACKGCAIRTAGGYKLVCKDGPVFNAREIVWEKGRE